MAQTIVKFSNWDIRRKCHGLNKRARDKRVSFRVHHDLTRRRYALLAKCRDRLDTRMAEIHGEAEVKDDQNVFVFVDVNSNLRFRAGRSVSAFSTEREFEDLFRHTFATDAFSVHN